MMARWALSVAALLVLVSGCGESIPSEPAEQGLMHLRKGRYDQAIAACDEAIRLDPHGANAYLVRGRSYQFRNEQGDADRAIADFSESIRIAPEQTEAYYSRAIAYRDQGNVEASSADETKARKLDVSIEQVYSHLPGTVSSSTGAASSSSPVSEALRAATIEEAEPNAGDILSERFRQRRPLESDSLDRQSGSAAADRTRRGTSRASTRDPLGLDLQSSRPQANGEADDNRSTYQVDQSYETPRGQPLKRSRSSIMSMDDQDIAPERRGAESVRGGTARGSSDSRWNEPTGPSAGGRSRGGRLSDLPRLPSPVQSPFPQLPPRPTGFVEDRTQSQSRPQPRQPFSSPYSVPTVHPPGAYHNDFDP